jgi:hypothetical protein
LNPLPSPDSIIGESGIMALEPPLRMAVNNAALINSV